MTFASRDAFPARGGVDDKPDRFPLSPARACTARPRNRRTARAGRPGRHRDQPCGSIGTQLAQTRDSSVTDSPLPSGSGSPGWVGARDGTPGGARRGRSQSRRRIRPRPDRPPARSSYVELHAHSAYSFLDGASLPEELAARAAELGYDALALTDHDGVYGSLEFAHAASTSAPRDHRRRGHASPGGGARTSRCSARRSAATRTSAGSSPTRTPARASPAASASCSRPRRRSTSSPRTPKGSSASPAARATASPRSTRTRAARLARAFPGAFYVELQRPFERGDARRNAALEELARDARRPHRRDRRRPRAPPAARPPPGRARRDPQPHLARRLRAGAPRQPRVRPAPAGRDARAAPARRRRAHARGRRPLRVRPDPGARLPLPRLLRRPRPRRRPAPRRLRPRLRRPLRERERPQARRAAAPRRRAGADRAARPRRLLPPPLGGARARARVRARGARPRLAAPRAAAGPRPRLERRLDRLLPDRPLARRPGRGEALARPLPQRRDGRRARHRPRLPARHPREADRRGHRALRPRARRARRELRDLPQPRRDPRRRQGARPAVRRARAARARHRRLARRAASARSSTRVPGHARRPALGRVPRADARDRRPAAPHLAAPGRDGRLVAAADRPRAGAARRDGRPAALPVGQGLVLRRALPQDRPARARDALGRRGGGRHDRAPARASRSTSRACRSTTRPSTPRSRRADTVGVFQIESRAQMQSLLRTQPGEPRRPDRAGRARPPGPDPGQGRPPVHREPPPPARGPGLRRAGRARVAARAARATRSASSSSRTRCSTCRWRRPGSAWGRPRGCGAR